MLIRELQNLKAPYEIKLMIVPFSDFYSGSYKHLKMHVPHDLAEGPCLTLFGFVFT